MANDQETKWLEQNLQYKAKSADVKYLAELKAITGIKVEAFVQQMNKLCIAETMPFATGELAKVNFGNCGYKESTPHVGRTELHTAGLSLG